VARSRRHRIRRGVPVAGPVLPRWEQQVAINSRNSHCNQLHMGRTWNVLVKRPNNTDYLYTETRNRRPCRGDVLETVYDGKLVKAEIAYHLHTLVIGGSVAWTVETTKI
jgi:hypothetical protein